MALRPKPTLKPVVEEAPAKRSEPSDEAFERVMRKAPDYRPDPDPEPEERKPKGVKMGNRRQITLTIFDDQIEAVDATARRHGMGRAAYINYAISQQLKRDNA